jgi:hypothetical protein
MKIKSAINEGYINDPDEFENELEEFNKESNDDEMVEYNSDFLYGSKNNIEPFLITF